MIYILWAVLNAVLLLYFFYLLIGFIVKGRDVFKGKLRPVAITVMALGVFHLVSATVPEEDKSEIILKKDYNLQTGTEGKNLILEENAAFDIGLSVSYSVEGEEWIPIKSRSYITGWVLGFDWEFYSFITNKIPDNGLSDFVVEGGLEWHLFGFHLYTQSKQFTGQLF